MGGLDFAKPGEEFDLRDWAAVGSALFAGFALLISLVTSRTARRALRLSERQEERRAQRLELYLREAVSFRSSTGSRRRLSCALTVVNPSDSPNSVISADLHVSLEAPNGVITTIKVPHSPDFSKMMEGSSALSIPLALGPKEATSGQLLFAVDEALTGKSRVDHYELVLHDINKRTESIEMSTFREVIDDEANG